jgi:large subunit ribosomal protein L25
LYGHDVKKPISLSVNYLEFKKIFDEVGESTMFELVIDGKERKNVLVKDVQYNPVSLNYDHIDLYQVKMTEKITANVELLFEGVSLAVKDAGGVLVKNIDEVEVEALPADLPKEIVVDISSLKTFEDVIKIDDLDIHSKAEILNEKDEIVATVSPPRSEEELKELDEEAEEKVEDVEGVEKEEPEEEATESEAAAAPEKKDENAEEGKEDKGNKEGKKEEKK